MAFFETVKYKLDGNGKIIKDTSPGIIFGSNQKYGLFFPNLKNITFWPHEYNVPNLLKDKNLYFNVQHLQSKMKMFVFGRFNVGRSAFGPTKYFYWDNNNKIQYDDLVFSKIIDSQSGSHSRFVTKGKDGNVVEVPAGTKIIAADITPKKGEVSIKNLFLHINTNDNKFCLSDLSLQTQLKFNKNDVAEFPIKLDLGFYKADPGRAKIEKYICDCK